MLLSDLQFSARVNFKTMSNNKYVLFVWCSEDTFLTVKIKHLMRLSSQARCGDELRELKLYCWQSALRFPGRVYKVMLERKSSKLFFGCFLGILTFGISYLFPSKEQVLDETWWYIRSWRHFIWVHFYLPKI